MEIDTTPAFDQIDQELFSLMTNLKSQGLVYMDCIEWYQWGLEHNDIFRMEQRLKLVDPIAEENARFHRTWGDLNLPTYKISKDQAWQLVILGCGIFDLLEKGEQNRIVKAFDKLWKHHQEYINDINEGGVGFDYS